MTDKHHELTESELDAVSAAGASGIDALIAVTQMKVDNANNNAMDTASHGGVVHAGWNLAQNRAA